MMHPDMVYRIATLRTEEITRNLRQRRPTAAPFWRRRRRRDERRVETPRHVVPVPPPRLGREPVDHERRVA